MIHTHSFLAFGLICGVWLCFALCRRVFRGGSAHVQFTAKVAALVLMLLAFGAQFVTPKLISRESSVFLYLALVCAAAFVLFVLTLLTMAIRKGFGIQLVKTWGVFLLIALLLAAPQLFTWTFSQASGDSFMRGWYNWGNLQDGYLWFYLESRRHGAVVPACIFHGRSASFHGLRSRSRHLVHLRVCRVPAEYL